MFLLFDDQEENSWPVEQKAAVLLPGGKTAVTKRELQQKPYRPSATEHPFTSVSSGQVAMIARWIHWDARVCLSLAEKYFCHEVKY